MRIGYVIKSSRMLSESMDNADSGDWIISGKPGKIEPKERCDSVNIFPLNFNGIINDKLPINELSFSYIIYLI